MTSSRGRGEGAQGWIHGPALDLLLGCGLAYAALFGLMMWSGDAVARVVPLEIAPLIALMVGAPHYGATLLRVYAKPEERRWYAFFAWGVTAVIAVAFLVGAHVVFVGSLLLTIYLTWSPWHYTGQNFGIATMFLHRRGAPVPVRAKKLLRASFVVSYLLTFVVLHSGGSATPGRPLTTADGVYDVLALGIPPSVTSGLAWPLAAAWLALGVAAFATIAARLRDAGARSVGTVLRPLLPSVLVWLSQSLWFVVPHLAVMADVGQSVFPLSLSNRVYTFFWIGIAHSAQYLWITSYFARKGGARTTGYLAACLGSGAALWAIPAILLSPQLFGSVPYEAGLALLVASAVNIHHFMLDGVIWKLRDGPVARILLRSEAATPASASLWGRYPSLRAFALVVGALFVVQQASGIVERNAVRAAASMGDAASLQRAVRRLAWLGYSNPSDYVELAAQLDKHGDVAAARAALDHSLEIHPTAAAWSLRGSMHAHCDDWPLAAQAFEHALTLDPYDPTALLGATTAQVRLGNRAAAEALRERAIEARVASEIAREIERQLAVSAHR